MTSNSSERGGLCYCFLALEPVSKVGLLLSFFNSPKLSSQAVSLHAFCAFRDLRLVQGETFMGNRKGGLRNGDEHGF